MGGLLVKCLNQWRPFISIGQIFIRWFLSFKKCSSFWLCPIYKHFKPFALHPDHTAALFSVIQSSACAFVMLSQPPSKYLVTVSSTVIFKLLANKSRKYSLGRLGRKKGSWVSDCMYQTWNCAHLTWVRMNGKPICSWLIQESGWLCSHT